MVIDLRHNSCKHYDTCAERAMTWWADCPDWQPEQRRDRVQEYADRLAAGCSCDNCVMLETEQCSTCSHLQNWVGYLEL